MESTAPLQAAVIPDQIPIAAPQPILVAPYKSTFKTSTLPQPEAVKNYLKQLLASDPYNRFCVECHQKLSTHVILALGLFMCKDCAFIVQGHLQPMHSRVKDIFGEHWDDYQLRCVNPAAEIGGGNKSFFEFMREYKLVDESGWVEAEKRYKHEAIKYYARRLWFRVDESPFNDLPPAKSYAEKYVRVKKAMSGWFHSTESKLGEIADKVDREAEKQLPGPDEIIPGIESRMTQVTAATEVSSENQKPGWKNKFKKIFKKGNKDKNEINPDIQKLASSGTLGDASAKTAMEENASVVTGNVSSSQAQISQADVTASQQSMMVPGLQIFPDFGVPTSTEEENKVIKPQQKFMLEEDGGNGNEVGELLAQEDEEDGNHGIF